MKNMCKRACYFILAILFIFSISTQTLAAVPDESCIGTCALKYEPIAFGVYNQYCTDPFDTLTALKNKMGWDRTYYSCWQYYDGDYYNCCYFFEDTSKQYFYVIEFDQDILDLDSIGDTTTDIS